MVRGATNYAVAPRGNNMHIEAILLVDKQNLIPRRIFYTKVHNFFNENFANASLKTQNCTIFFGIVDDTFYSLFR